MPAERAATSSNLCRSWPGGLKLGIALATALIAGLLPGELWPATACLGVFALLLHSLAGTPLRTLVRRVAQFLPFVIVLSFGALISRPEAATAVWSAALLLRCLVAFLIGLWLMQVLTASEFLDVLARWRVPAALSIVLSFMLRYVALLWEEHERLLRAQRSRAGGPHGRWTEWRAAIERLGLLVLRALDRAERVHRAMLARGWSGTSSLGGDAP
ncbi:MAG TPA: energy-coupling factor transporter transmembrane component T [Planctomycetaceae bacterium]|nr:energy-coupling factor transporter transmembrane component T [Planctomycetaceae bacterium]